MTTRIHDLLDLPDAVRKGDFALPRGFRRAANSSLTI